MRRSSRTPILASVLVAVFAAPFVVSAAPSGKVLAQTGEAPAASATPDASASAAPAADEAQKKEEAKEHFLKGVSLMQEEQWEAAYVEFTASLALFPTRNARKNAAVCLRQLGRFAEALDMYELLLKEFAAQLPPADAEQVNKAVNDLKGLVGYLSIESNVAGATVIVDSKQRGTTPIAPVRVSQGTHVIRVFKEGYLPFETTQAVLGKQTVPVQANLEVLSRSGRISIIEESGAEAEVFIDGAPKGKVGKQPYEERIAPGLHWVVLKGEGKLGTQPAPVNVQVDQTFVLRLRLEELPGEARIETDPVGSNIILDGVPVGQGSWEGRLRVGQHKIDATSEGYFRTTKTFEVGADGKATVKVALDRDENSPFWTKGRTRPISIGLFGSGFYGPFGLGSDYERSCGVAGTDCYERTRPFGGMGAVFAGYEVAPGLSLEVQLGYAYVKSELSRKTTLIGEQNAQANVNITDTWSVQGLMVGVGAAYAFVRRPIVISGAVSGGAIVGATVRVRRAGDFPCLANNQPDCSSVLVDPNPTNDTREVEPRSMQPAGRRESATIPWFAPEMRFALPIGEMFQVGLSVGALVGIGNVRPLIFQTPDAKSGELQPRAPAPVATPTDQPKTIGFVPQQNARPEAAIGTFVLPRASVFVKVAF